jgi:hypothetical protein
MITVHSVVGVWHFLMLGVLTLSHLLVQAALTLSDYRYLCHGLSGVKWNL